MLDVNVRAVLELSQVAATVFRARGAGLIVNVSSTAAYWSSGTYAGTKAWVLAVTQGLAVQCRQTGVRVMALVPGFTRTEFHGRSSTDASGVHPWLWLTPQQVASEAFMSIEAGHEVCIPGWRYRFLVGAVRHLPPAGRSRVLRWLAPLSPQASVN
jgi:short-subunit dehydrogenase